MIKIKLNQQGNCFNLGHNHVKMQISLEINESIGCFYE